MLLAKLDCLFEVQNTTFVHFYCESNTAHRNEWLHGSLHKRIHGNEFVEQFLGTHRCIFEKAIQILDLDDHLKYFLPVFWTDVFWKITVMQDVFLEVDIYVASEMLLEIFFARPAAIIWYAKLSLIVAEEIAYLFILFVKLYPHLLYVQELQVYFLDLFLLSFIFHGVHVLNRLEYLCWLVRICVLKLGQLLLDVIYVNLFFVKLVGKFQRQVALTNQVSILSSTFHYILIKILIYYYIKIARFNI